MASVQKAFNPVDYHFEWINDGTWYWWDRKKGQQAALAARKAEAAKLKAEGYRVVLSTLPNQFITVGGIGSGHPQLDFVTSVYYLNAVKVG